MKKKVVKKKFKTTRLFTLLFICLFIVSVFMGLNAFADGNVFKLLEAAISDKSEDVTGNITSIDNSDINSDITFHEVGGNVTYTIKLKNTFEDKVKILSISDNNDSDYLIYEYDKHENEEIESNDSFDFIVKVIYQNEITEISERNKTYNVDFLISYEKNGKVEEDTLIINPKTSDNITLSIVLFIISSGGLVICFMIDKKKNTKRIVYVLAIFLLVPFTVNAVTITYNVSLKSNFQLYDKVIVTYEVNGEEFTYLNKYNSILDLEEPEVAGYRFDKWLNEDGSDFDTSSVLTEDTKIVAKMTKLEATFDTGRSINVKLSRLTGTSGNAYNSTNNLMTAFVKSPTKPDLSTMTNDNKISISNSMVPIYAWFDNGTIYWWSEDIDPALNSDCYQMFDGFKAAETIDLSGTDGSNLTNMHEMFSGCSSLVNLNFGENFKTGQVMDMYNLFEGCSSLKSLDLSGFDTSKVTSMRNLFRYCSSLETLELGDNFDTSKVTDMQTMFQGCSSLKTLNLGSKFDTSNVVGLGMVAMFDECSNLTSLNLGNKFNPNKVESLYAMFRNCSSLTSLNLGTSFNTGKTTSMNEMFKNCSRLTSINLGNNFDTSKVTNMTEMFSNCSSLTSIDLGNKFNTGSVTGFFSMFKNCSKLTSIDLGDKFDTSNAYGFGSMFENCSKLTSIDLGNKFDTSKATGTGSMFRNCSSLTSLDLGDKFDTSNVTSMGYMFENCSSLTSLNLGDKFDTSKVTYMREMFYNCSNLTSLDLGDKFDTSSVTQMPAMFFGCKKLTVLDLGDKFDTSNVTWMASMFRNCENLTTIYANEKFDSYNARNNYAQVFEDSKKLIGGAGTTYQSFRYNGDYARMDDPANDKPGYFTNKDNGYVVVFHTDYGTVSPTFVTRSKGATVGELPVLSTQDFKDFDGWYTDSTGGVKVNSDTKFNYNVHLYARYIDLEIFDVTFDTDGGDSMAVQKVGDGRKVTKPSNPTKTDYEFVDWYTDDTYTTKFNFNNTIVTSDITIYAKFKPLMICPENDNITTLSSTKCSGNENVIVSSNKICKRAINLHEETCNGYCKSAGYTETGSQGTTTITYGSCGTSNVLSPGDAFTCDINGDGKFDELAERFYYVSDYYNTSEKSFDSNTAVLVYYNNVTRGMACNKNAFSYSTTADIMSVDPSVTVYDNIHGPLTTIKQLPTPIKWGNVNLKYTTRTMLAEFQNIHDFPTTEGGTLITNFSYDGYSSRLLTAKELMNACGLSQLGNYTTGELDSCNYLMQNSRYAKFSYNSLYGFLLETPNISNFRDIYCVDGTNRRISICDSTSVVAGVRPVIDVPKSKIKY